MSPVEIFLWPVAGFLVVAALAGLWQARKSGADSGAARRRSAILGALAAALLAWLLVESRT